MSIVKKISFLLLGFMAFIVLFARVCFLVGISINFLTLFISLFVFTLLSLLFIKSIKSTVFFLVIIALLSFATLWFAKTYDTSWDGQGYHQSAVIALATGWNPIYQPKIHFEQELPSQIFAESYPPALWEIQASIYAVTDIVNSAKVTNLAIACVSFLMCFALFRRMYIGKLYSVFLGLLVVVQPLFVIQFLSFMEDGFGYQLVVIAAASLIYFILESRSVWAISMFILSEIFLASTKYSHLPTALVLGLIFAAVATNRFLNKEYFINKRLKAYSLGIVAVCALFAYLPYGRNLLFHHSAFYPTNVTELSGSVTYNNLPHNLEGKNKLVQFFYGIFSKSQTYESSDTRSSQNVATLKLPFTFTKDEMEDAAKLYNNRAGSEGPIFSGIFLLSLGLLVFMSFKAETTDQKYTIYGILFSVFLIVVTSLAVPTPNLVRYVSQVQLMPIVLVAPLLSVFRQKYLRVFSGIIFALVLFNNTVFSAFVVAKNIDEQKHINNQFTQMRSSGSIYLVRAQHFYSNYILLNEQKIHFYATDRLACSSSELYASSTTTRYCEK